MPEGRNGPPDSGEIRYLVLADRAVPYLLARVRWPDVAQAISAACPDWLDDPGLFDLPYDPAAVTVSFPQAVSVAEGWGRRLDAEAEVDVPSYMRRMPANWSDLSPSERRTWGIEFVGRRRVAGGRIRRRRPAQARITDSSAAARAKGRSGALARLGRDPGADVDGAAASDGGQRADVTSGLASLRAERRRHRRLRLDGRAHIRCGHTTISAGLVDLSERGVRCVLPEASSLIAPGATLGGAFLLEAEVYASRICLAVAGRVSWHQFTGGPHFGVAFEALANDETEGVRRLLAAAGRRRARR